MVVLPLVPLTRATGRPAVNRGSRAGSTARPARPPTTVPLPRPKTRETALTVRVAATAARDRVGQRHRDDGRVPPSDGGTFPPG